MIAHDSPPLSPAPVDELLSALDLEDVLLETLLQAKIESVTFTFPSSRERIDVTARRDVIKRYSATRTASLLDIEQTRPIFSALAELVHQATLEVNALVEKDFPVKTSR